MATAYVNGLQTNGVASTIKHFVCNDQEHERMSADSVVSDRALREIYLYPFMLAQRDAKPMAYMPRFVVSLAYVQSSILILMGDDNIAMAA